VSLLEATLPAGTVAYVGRDNTGDVTINALTGKQVHVAIAGSDILNISGTAVAITGNLSVTGTFGISGPWDVGDTLTADELILDTDGVAPGATNCYAVRDNAGDLTVNAITGKVFHIAIAGSDEYDFSAAALDMLGNDLDNCGSVVLNTSTAPAGTEVYAVHDNAGDLTLNAKAGKEVHIAIAGTDEYDFNATAFQIASGNNIQFLGDNGMLDSNGNEAVFIEAVAGATTYLNVKNANAGNVVLECQGAADLGFTFANDQDEEVLVLTPVASATVELTVLNAATGGQPVIRVTGEADLGVEIQNLAGEVMLETLSSTAPVNWIAVGNADTGARPYLLNPGEDDVGIEFRAKNNEQLLILAATAAAVNEVTITSAAAAGSPTISATGDDADIHLTLAAKGTGGVVAATLYGSVASGGDLVLASTAHATKGDVRIPSGEVGFKVGGTTERGTVGTNAIHLYPGTAPAGALNNCVSLYAEGADAASELKAMDAAGNVTVLSPHTDDGDYVIHSYSAVKDETVTIHIEKLIKALAADPKLAKFVKVASGHVKKPKGI